jgi:hypothetical protein
MLMALVPIFILGVGRPGLAAEKLEVALAVTEEYSDNLFFDRHDRVDDFLTTISPKLTFTGRTERVTTSLGARLDGLVYAEEDDLDDIEQFYTADMGYRVSPLVSIRAGAGYTRDSRVDRDIETTGLVLGTTAREKQHYALSGTWQATEKTTGTLGCSLDRDDYDDAEFTDSQVQVVSAGVARNFGAFDRPVIGRVVIGYGRYDYDDTTTDNYSGTLGIEYDPGECWRLIANAGVRYTRSEMDLFYLDRTTTGWGAVGDLSLVFTGETTGMRLGVSHSLQPDAGGDGSVERTSIRGTISRRFTEKLRGTFSGAFHFNTSEDNDLATTETDEQTLTLRPGFSWMVSDNIALEGSYAYTRVHDRVDDTDTERNLVFLGIVCSYPLVDR